MVRGFVAATLAALAFGAGVASAADSPTSKSQDRHAGRGGLLRLAQSSSLEKSYQIAAQPVSTALKVFAAQSNMQLIFTEGDVGDARTSGVQGKLAPQDALAEILRGTDLKYEFTANDVVVIRKSASRISASTHESVHLARIDSASSSSDPQAAIGASEAATNEVRSVSAVEERSDRQVEEIVVTAQKREERLQDVPVPVTVLSADSLVDNNLLQLRDYYSKVPGLSYTPSGVGSPLIVIRGLTTGGANATVGVVLDDVPYGASSYAAGGYSSYDIDPSDLARIEVLRGPQGTLYGASSLGGLIKYVTVDPSTESFGGRVQMGTSALAASHGAGYYLRGSLNMPLGETFAIRASGFTRRDPGYIDNVQTGQRDVNLTEAKGGRVAALWRPTEGISLKLSALQQRIDQPGSAQVDLEPGLEGLQNTNMRGTGGIKHDLEAYSANLTVKAGTAEVTAVAGYNRDKFNSPLDLSFPFFNDVSQQYFGGSGTGLELLHRNQKFTQEVRLAMPLGQRVDWVLGVFHAAEKGGEFNGIYAADPATGQNVGFWDNVYYWTTFNERALFSNFTIHVTDRFDVQVGGRTGRSESTAEQLINGAVFSEVFGTPDPSIIPKRSAKDSAFTYLVTPQFKISPDLMVYARLASGYRPGGANIGLPGTPLKYASDSTRNYEIGIKGDALNHAASFDASLYYIDWKDLQLSLNDGFSTFFANGGRAKSQGLEVSSSWRPWKGMTLSGWVAWNDAKLSEPLPATSLSYGASGDRLPYSSRYSGTLAAEQEFPLRGSASGFVGGSASYVGERLDIFPSNNFATGQPAGPRLRFPSYTRVDLQAGVRSGPWSGSLFINNVGDERGIVSGGYDPVNNTNVSLIQPRTIGLSLSRTF